jgi:NADH-quinone oxidoreductase subunit N
MLFNFALPSVDWLTIAPTVIVATVGVLALCIEMIWHKRNNNGIVWFCLLGLVAAGAVVVRQVGLTPEETLAGMVVRDQFGLVMQLLVIGAAFLTILFSEGYLREKRIPFGEFYPLLLWSASGAMIMATTKNLLMLFLGLEVLSIALYVLAGMARHENKSEESALKYFLLGAFASGFLLYGIAFIYGATGSLHMDQMLAGWTMGNEMMRGLLVFGLGLVLVGLCFKSAFVPFHQWTPDVYQGAPTNVTAFMAAGSKIGALAALWRFLDAVSFEQITPYWMPALYWVAIITMVVGNLIALLQKDVKRVLGYSSIAHAGYILVGILAHVENPAAVDSSTISYYLLSYSIMTIGAFAVVSITARAGQEGTRFDDVRGLWKRSPLAAVSLIVFMASLIGIPPTAGFFGKFFIFGDALAAGLTPLAIVLAVTSIISLYYYLGIGLAMFVSDEDGQTAIAPMSAGLRAACILCVVGVFAAAIFLYPIQNFIKGPSEKADMTVAARLGYKTLSR